MLRFIEQCKEAELKEQLEVERERARYMQKIVRTVSGLNFSQKHELHMLNKAIVRKNKRIKVLQEQLKKVTE